MILIRFNSLHVPQCCEGQLCVHGVDDGADVPNTKQIVIPSSTITQEPISLISSCRLTEGQIRRTRVSAGLPDYTTLVCLMKEIPHNVM